MPDEHGNPTIEERRQRAWRAVQAYADWSGHVERVDDEVRTVLADLIADLHHLCDSLELDDEAEPEPELSREEERWEAVLASADMHYQAEAYGVEPP